jgi:hypothetical protein
MILGHKSQRRDFDEAVPQQLILVYAFAEGLIAIYTVRN